MLSFWNHWVLVHKMRSALSWHTHNQPLDGNKPQLMSKTVASLNIQKHFNVASLSYRKRTSEKQNKTNSHNSRDIQNLQVSEIKTDSFSNITRLPQYEYTHWNSSLIQHTIDEDSLEIINISMVPMNSHKIFSQCPIFTTSSLIFFFCHSPLSICWNIIKLITQITVSWGQFTCFFSHYLVISELIL